MTHGIRRRWERGPRSIITSKDRTGRDVVRLGKRGGPVIQQTVVLVLELR